MGKIISKFASAASIVLVMAFMVSCTKGGEAAFVCKKIKDME